MASVTATRAELEEKISQFNSNWLLCGADELAHDWEHLDKMDEEHKNLIDWFAHQGITFNDLSYNRETSTFGLPESIMTSAST